MTSKIKIVSWIFITVLFISGCGKKQSTTSTSSPSSTSETTRGETNPSVSTETTRSSTQSVDNQPLSVEGNWTATGKEDHLESNWLFKDSTLTINGQEIFYYDVAPKVDKNGYTHVEIVNVESIIHGLLLKKSPSGMSGYRVEGEVYQDYLKTAELPTNQQEIEFIPSIGDPTIWKNKEEAIDFYEKVYKNPANELSKDIDWENYRRDLWNVLQDGTYDNVIAMRFSTIKGSGDSYIRLIRDIETTEMILFGENSSYPDHPSSRLVIRNSDYLVLETENYSY